MPIRIPSTIEQEKIVKFLGAIETKVKNVKIELELNNEFKRGLLQQMFC